MKGNRKETRALRQERLIRFMWWFERKRVRRYIRRHLLQYLRK